jgi:cytoskeletal protein CcmA (bactofilin family)
MALFSNNKDNRPAPAPAKAPPPARSSPAAAGTSTASQRPGDNRSGRSSIGAKLSFEGTVTGTEPLVIEGTVKGKIDLSSDVTVAPDGQVDAAVHGRNVLIEGTVVGDISADERVELVASASVDGNIRAPKIIVAEGARFRGSVDMGSRVPPGAAAEPEERKDGMQ